MRTLRALLLRVIGLFRRRAGERELEAELQSHLEMHVADNVRAGMSDEEARRRALLSLGGIQRAKDVHRDRRSLPMIDELAQDIRYGLRKLVNKPGFSSIAIFTLTLAIAANTFVFTFMNTVLFRPLPFDEPHRLIVVRTVAGAGRGRGVSYLDFQDWKKTAGAFKALAAYRGETTMNVADEGHSPERLLGSYVSANTFSTLGTQPFLGRDFQSDDDRSGAASVVILGHRLWLNRYSGDPTVLGRTIRINGVPVTVIGVMPPGFGFPTTSNVWQPLSQMPEIFAAPRDVRNLDVFGRLADGMDESQADAEMSVVTARLSRVSAHLCLFFLCVSRDGPFGRIAARLADVENRPGGEYEAERLDRHRDTRAALEQRARHCSDRADADSSG